jgi:hypothetical protein
MEECGNVETGLEALEARVKLMMHVRDRRGSMAVLLALSREKETADVPSSWNNRANWPYKLMEVAGLDWEKLVSSSLLSAELVPEENRILLSSAAEFLAARGSTYGAKVVLGSESWASQKGVPLNVVNICSFITPGILGPPTRPEIEPEVQDQLVKLLASEVKRRRNDLSVVELLQSIARLQRPVFRDVIRPLQKSRFETIASQAGAALRMMGESPEPFRKQPDARLEVYLNGKRWRIEPAATTHLTYDLMPQYATNRSGPLPFLFPASAQNNVLEFSRDLILNMTDKALAAHLVSQPNPDERTSLVVALERPWFAAPVRLPISFSTVNKVHVSTWPLLLSVSYPRPIDTIERGLIEMELTSVDIRAARSGPLVFRGPILKSYRFAALQAGRYRLAVTAPGAARWESDVIVKKSMPPLQVQLKRGSDVRLKIALPAFDDSERVAFFPQWAASTENGVVSVQRR